MNNKQLINGYLKALDMDNQIFNIEDITKLMKTHVKTFPFSSLKVLLKEDISLELEDIYTSLVVQKRGGYCFEHNKLFYEVLKGLGFDVQYFLARVVNNTENMVPQTHRFTLLNFEDEQYLLDVGIGFRTPAVPVKFGKEYSSNHFGTSFIIKELEDNLYALQIIKDDEIFTVTKFDLNKCYESDFEMGHFYSYKNPCAVFVNNFVISSINDSEVRSFVNDTYFKISGNSQKKVEINSFGEFQKILEGDFNLNFDYKEIEFFYNNFVEKK